ncbi:peptidoglycan D,D-transpeptidase FtsI family protein [Rudaeicoccus suwonensis]|uniref:Cell elongation-specific peptidoglycan D,D-transpeptidase n=1 Tax=Rudaeicoccus suwonensis TaxID=657409 RepID=A0A561E463_9MICO|nr:penicillin-binding transpeptidase domain-containing protein [Rudaeicoccus suwonensis]TWE10407.1 cell elongation-specific peptidoglycan D,D-transpeptidase [Rudaeicoccus suwonensis]
MNVPIRRLGLVAAAMFCALLVSTTIIQFFQARSLDDRPGNRRTLLASYSKERGSILVGGTAVAVSKPTNDDLKWLRTYPQGSLYATATGYYSFTYGSSGVERAYDSFLSGNSDKLFYRHIIDVLTGKPAQGASVQLTLNAKAQEVATKALGNQRGAVVALDPQTGAILALVTSPTYDPNPLASHNLVAAQNAYTQLLNDPAQPLVDRAINGNLYPPGSTFKLIVSAAALSSGKYTPSTLVPGPAELRLPGTDNYLPNDFHNACGPDDKVSFIKALQISCNTAYASVGMALGQDAVRSMAQKFGFGQPLSIPMSVTPSVFPATLNLPQLAQSSIGQFDVRASPMQMAMVSAAIANGGKEMTPYLVSSVRDTNLDVIQSTSPKVFSNPISSQVASELTTMMESVVTGGTGTNAAIPGVQVAGKTGTAQHGSGENADVWFTGFAPATNPKVAVAVIVENGGTVGQDATGGIIAAPIAKQVMEAVLGQ